MKSTKERGEEERGKKERTDRIKWEGVKHHVSRVSFPKSAQLERILRNEKKEKRMSHRITFVVEICLRGNLQKTNS